MGSIEQWLRAAGFEISSTHLYEAHVMPPAQDVDFLVVMGGPMSVNDEVTFPWLAAERLFIRAVVESGTPVLGVCLGAQLIAAAMGGRVYQNPVKEIGWFPVTAVQGVPEWAFTFPPSTEVFHWHGETFSLPPAAVHLARSEACENQAFQLGRSVIGLQFHLETTPDSARALVDNCRHELTPAPYVQTEQELVAVPPERYEEVNRVMDNVLAYLAAAAR
jgi:GMP synthase-like glutamine amidotransferase